MRQNSNSNDALEMTAKIADLLDSLRPGFIFPKGPRVIFKAKLQEQGRIAIPEAEREELRLIKGDTVQVILWKVGTSSQEESGPRRDD